MIEDILRNATRLVSPFLEVKYFYGFYKCRLCDCAEIIGHSATTSEPSYNPRLPSGFGHNSTDTPPNDGPSDKTTNNSYANMLRSIPGAYGLRIECSLFLWLSSDVGNLLQVLDVSCMGCGELDPIHVGCGHG